MSTPPGKKKLNGVRPPDRISQLLQDKVFLVTGATGFMGKVIIEKVLRSCDVKKMYLLIRDKKGKDPQSRVKALFASPLFDLLKKTKGEDILKKVIAIGGDVALPGLGLSKEDRQLLAKEVNIIYHFAATVRFDDTIKRAVLLNTRGTQLMLKLAKECKNLKVFVHVSTAYCHLNEKVLYEKAYPPSADPNAVITTVEWLDEEAFERVRNSILDAEPNTYTFSKALAEGLVNNEMDNLPVIILRFPVVIPGWKEPIPGWSDTINGPAGLFIAAGKGVLRTMYCDPKGYADFLPVDIAANCVVVATYDYMVFKERRIYNCTSSNQYKLTWSDIIEIGTKVVTTKMPFNMIMWYPGGSLKRSKLLHWICVIFFHYGPALVLDPFIWLSGNKPVLLRVQQRLTKSFEVFEYFTNNQWDFNNDQAVKAREWMNETEREKYDVVCDNLDIEDYLVNCIHSARRYVLNESDESLPGARASLRRMWYVDRFCKGLILLGLAYCLSVYILSPVFGNLF